MKRFIIFSSVVFLTGLAIILLYLMSDKKLRRDGSIPETSIVINPLIKEDFTFKGINPNQEFSQLENAIENILGKPMKLEEKDGKDPGVLERMYYYSNFSVSTSVFQSVEYVGDIEITGLGPKTSRGITVGDPAGRIIKQYGKADISDFKGSTYYHYFFQTNDSLDGSYVLEFKLKDNFIEIIKIYYYSD